MRLIRMNSLMKFISPLATNKRQSRNKHATWHICMCVCVWLGIYIYWSVQQHECRCCGKKVPQATCCTNQHMWCFYAHKTHTDTYAHAHSAANLCNGLPLKWGRTANNFQQWYLLPFRGEDIKKRMLQSAAKACKLFAEF